VEAETLACGTGTVASSIISDISVNGLVSRKSNFIEAKTKSGEALKVHFDIEGKMVKNVWLEGKSQLVFEGTIKNV
jgi:diaminopimelate epimerase